MKHQKKGRKLHRKKDQRNALLKSMGESLILEGEIITTEARAKELKRFIEKKISVAKKGGVQNIRNLRKYFSENASQKLVKEIVPALKEKNGGYTRITKIGSRKNDNAPMVKIEILKNH
ncbi:MAG TPA: 50S ribosomal protein L17 [Candidatus Pacearchaeota archaeon]|nr:50S ribosomal protein L17 [Candidatus Pacearchaeota archaeon]HOK94264.1 50S ribosomal protein L17 [Candidatus Pacearchaeota archaeon]HPO75378.1 50S ribosomal protein L17 [Candidatus Pacearchaeota archaeon]